MSKISANDNDKTAEDAHDKPTLASCENSEASALLSNSGSSKEQSAIELPSTDSAAMPGSPETPDAKDAKLPVQRATKLSSHTMALLELHADEERVKGKRSTLHPVKVSDLSQSAIKKHKSSHHIRGGVVGLSEVEFEFRGSDTSLENNDEDCCSNAAHVA